jgi:acetolactate synthase small subunit
MSTLNPRKNIVVAGGTGSVGQNIVDAILATGKYSVIVFSRRESLSLIAKGVTVVSVDYNDHQRLVQALQDVHTVISCIADLNESCRDAQLALLKAALAAGVKRFAPSEWAGLSEKNTAIEIYTTIKKPVVDAVKNSGIEYTLFCNGLFMDYFASPQKSNPYLEPMPFGVDINQCTAWFAGTGDEPINVTLLEDMAKFVAASLDMEKWQSQSGVIGSRTSWNEIVRLGEQVRGQKFDVKRQTIEEMLATKKPNSTDFLDTFYRDAMVHFAQGEVEYEPTLNECFPQIKLTKIDEFIEQWWNDKKGQVL